MNKKIAIFHPDVFYADDLMKRLQAALPEHDIQLWHEGFDPKYLLAWKPSKASLENPSLEIIFSLGAGVDTLIYNKDLPKHLKIVRLEEAGMGDQMLEFALYGILYHSRGFDIFHKAKQNRQWLGISTPKKLPFQSKIGVLGLGQLGGHIATKLANLGYPVSGYSYSKKHLSGVNCYDNNQLDEFLAQSEVLICLLPLTDQTQGFLNLELFKKLPKHAFLMNLARGGHLIEDDLIPALNQQYLSGAFLDVFQTEPLHTKHPFWGDDRIVITPHLAAITTKPEAVKQISQNIINYEANKPLTGLVDVSKQY